MKKFINIILLATIIVACTDRFERVNSNPFAITAESLTQDYNFGVSFTNLYRSFMCVSSGDYLYASTWQADNYVTQAGVPTDQSSGRDMMRYFFQDTWNNYVWNKYYNNQMAPALILIERAKSYDEPLFLAMSELIQVMAVSQMTIWYGPVIYSEYGQDLPQYDYDSEEYLYDQLFPKLDEIKNAFFNASGEQASVFAKFDPQYGAQSPTNYSTASNPTGNTKAWAKAVNSYKLRLAMRIVKAKPALAKQKFEEAVNDPAGLILSNADNFWCYFTGTHPLWTISNSWNDVRMGSGHEEVLIGFEDPRIFRWWRKVDDNTSANLSAKFYNFFPSYEWPSKNPNFQGYKGIAPGSWLDFDKFRDSYSCMPSSFNDYYGNYRRLPCLLASEVYFMLAEAALRGWNVPKSTREYYEDGVLQSFLEWGVPDAAAAAAAYLADDTKMPIDYEDPADKYFNNPNENNSYKTRMTDPEAYTVKWRDDVSDEKKLERIMTQKWIASFTNSWETWSDFRRTGYPKLTPARKNVSTAEWGIIPEGEHIKRTPFVQQERLSNPGITNAIQKLGGPNSMNTRLWIHPSGPNF